MSSPQAMPPMFEKYERQATWQFTCDPHTRAAKKKKKNDAIGNAVFEMLFYACLFPCSVLLRLPLCPWGVTNLIASACLLKKESVMNNFLKLDACQLKIGLLLYPESSNEKKI